MRGDRSDWTSRPAPRITPDDVQRKEFGTARVRAGYLMHEVDEFLDQITDTLSAVIAENERLRAELAGAPRAEARPAAGPSDADDRAAVQAFLQREKAFLQSLGSLVQAHASELKDMVRAARVPSEQAAAPPPAVDEPEPEPAPEPAGEPASPAETIAGTAAAPAPRGEAPPETALASEPEPPSASTPLGPGEGSDGDDVPAILDATDGETGRIETVDAEQPIRVDEPEPASRGRPDDRSEGSLRELFWGEE
ncbi:MAG TPA: DivIVA domain-containing protein [Actinomycetota bacterium]|nr:DivIVA domain-containing protein [Actinomycetota bacterium]